MLETYQDHYRILGVYRSATQEDIKLAYRKLIRKYHPDSNKSVSNDDYCKKINFAYYVLSAEQSRAAFDYVYDKKNSIWQPRLVSSTNWIKTHWKQIGIFIGGTTVIGFGAYFLTKKMWYMSSSTADLPLPTPITIVQEVPVKNLENSFESFLEITKINNLLQYVTTTPLTAPVLDSIRSSFVIISRAWQNIRLIVDSTILPEPVAKSATFIENQATTELTEKLQRWTAGLALSSPKFQSAKSATFIENQATTELTEKLQRWTAGLALSSPKFQGGSTPGAIEKNLTAESTIDKATSEVVNIWNWAAASTASLASRLSKSNPEAKEKILSAASTIAKAAENLRKSNKTVETLSNTLSEQVPSMLSKLFQFIYGVFLSILNFFS